MHVPLRSEKEIRWVTIIQVVSGAGVRHLANRLHQHDLLRHPQFFIWLAQLIGDAPLLKAGEYQITRSMTPEIYSIISWQEK